MVLRVLVLICAGMTARIKFGTLSSMSTIPKKPVCYTLTS